MNTPNDGGPAFPWEPSPGMSLRDWFAGMALPAKIADIEAFNDKQRAGGGTTVSKDDVADSCYRYADSMLKARANHLGTAKAASEPPGQPKPRDTAPGSPWADPGEGWFLLATGIPLQPGDGFFYPQENCWVDFDCRPDVFRGSKALKLPKKDFAHTWPWRRKKTPQGTAERGEGDGPTAEQCNDILGKPGHYK